MITISELTKQYGNFTAVDRASFTVKDGEITILLGQNGAGKSTTIKSVAGLLACSGQITIDGEQHTSIEAKRRFGYIPETPILYGTLTVEEHIHFIGKAYRMAGYMDYAEELLVRFDMQDKKKKLAKELSKGMTQKLSMILAMLPRPHTLLIDEPMIGLDPPAIEAVLQIFTELKEQGGSILISTHIIDIVSDIWDSAYIMERGHVVKGVTRQELEIRGESLKQMFFEVIGGDNHEWS